MSLLKPKRSVMCTNDILESGEMKWSMPPSSLNLRPSFRSRPHHGYWGNALISILTTVLKAKRAPVTRQVSYTFIYITEHISYWEMHTEGHKALAVVP